MPNEASHCCRSHRMLTHVFIGNTGFLMKASKMIRFVVVGNLHQFSKALTQGCSIICDKKVHTNLCPVRLIGSWSDCSLDVVSLGTQSIDIRQSMSAVKFYRQCQISSKKFIFSKNFTTKLDLRPTKDPHWLTRCIYQNHRLFGCPCLQLDFVRYPIGRMGKSGLSVALIHLWSPHGMIEVEYSQLQHACNLFLRLVI